MTKIISLKSPSSANLKIDIPGKIYLNLGSVRSSAGNKNLITSKKFDVYSPKNEITLNSKIDKIDGDTNSKYSEGSIIL